VRIRQISVIRGLWFELILIVAEYTADDADLTGFARGIRLH